MRLTILETGRPPAAIAADFPDYPAMFRKLLAPVGPELCFSAAPLVDGARPPDLETFDAALITGSPLGVYDDVAWLDDLRGFIRRAAADQKPLVGICFGHQIMADALGGVVRKSSRGWGVGRHRYEITAPQTWMAPSKPAFAVAASHQDQVETPPPDAVTIAASAFTPHAALAYRSAPAISFQGHPEMDDRFAGALYASRRGRIDDGLVDAALASLAEPNDAGLIAQWIVAFLRAPQLAR